ncbi:AraC family transcriptional regulator [Microbacterium sp. RURRCA19A]|uniref:AraC family transcriptional regulator n=1 Tax=Microbacterium sp. RURRCA19A TaxID=1907391 RepID=UPI000956C96A|nr:AraC family transcriptional regulator [Microbacterium sp. RURRCA19A]SIS08154.1 AraC-type DNA-binding protein [Microbacterium sp. RURRCA19A]
MQDAHPHRDDVRDVAPARPVAAAAWSAPLVASTVLASGGAGNGPDRCSPLSTPLDGMEQNGHRRFAHAPGAPADPQRMRAFVVQTGFRVLEGEPARLSLQSVDFPAYTIAHLRSAPFLIEWPRESPDARRRGVFVFVNRGTLKLSGSGTNWTADGGGLCIVFPGPDPVRIRGCGENEMIFFSFDTNEIEPLSLEADAIGRISPNSPVFRASYAYLKAAAFAPTGSSDDAEESGILRSLTRDVARSLVLASTTTRRRDRVFTAARSIIAQEYRDPRFSPTRLAARLGVSRSTLERAFRHNALHVAQEIRRHRAHHAMALLSSDPSLSIDLIARASGFGSRSTLSRAFREIYGVAPERARGVHTTSVSA